MHTEVLCMVTLMVTVCGQTTPKPKTTGTTTGTSSSLTNATTKTTGPSTTTIPPATMSPGEHTNFTLVLTNDGPTVLDGWMTFRARLLDAYGRKASPKQFHYDWNNNADQDLTTTDGDLESSFGRRFESHRTKAGTWVMTVAVYSQTRQMVIFGSMKFVLTDSLNGKLILQQSLDYKREEKVDSLTRP